MRTAGKHEGQAGGGDQHLHGDLGIVEQHRLAGLDVGGGDGQARGGGMRPAAAGSSRSASRWRSGLWPKGLSWAGRNSRIAISQPRQSRELDRSQPNSQRSRGPFCKRAEVVRLGDAPPQPAHFLPRPGVAAAHQALHQQRAEDGAGRHAADGADPQPILEQSVEHPPGEGAMGTAALQRRATPGRRVPLVEHVSVMPAKVG